MWLQIHLSKQKFVIVFLRHCSWLKTYQNLNIRIILCNKKFCLLVFLLIFHWYIFYIILFCLHRNNLYKILEFHVKSSSSSHEGNSRNGRKMTTVHLFITYSPLNSFYIFNTIVRYSCSLYVSVCSYKRLKNGLSFVTFLTWQ